MVSDLTSAVDALMIGPGDLRLDMGLPGFAGEEPEYLEAFKIVERAARVNNLPIAGFARGPQIGLRLSQGWTLFIITADCLALLAGQAGSLFAGRNAVKEFINSKENVNGSA
jgi:2-keto-3-deoxy-L-rhamnonate aldolase RhmA